MMINDEEKCTQCGSDQLKYKLFDYEESKFNYFLFCVKNEECRAISSLSSRLELVNKLDDIKDKLEFIGDMLETIAAQQWATKNPKG